MKNNLFFKLLVSLGLSGLAGAIGSIFTVSAISNWYIYLNKSALNPPDFVFGPVWTILYIFMGVAMFLVWQKGLEKKEVRTALKVFLFQLFLNILWSVFFFGFKDIFAAFFGIIALWFAVLATILSFAKISRLAFWLLIPYILWISFAAYLNYSIWLLN
ncbi:MAG: tryptophan-rich sensory protein [Candidatus Pacebacteria bacterium]|nr:tryptophan-rich sensory protein [Candidatus Paceibacterota bacterium]